VIYDDDNYFMGGALAERLRGLGHEVALITPDVRISSWTVLTDEHEFVQKRLLTAGVTLHTSQRVTGFEGGSARSTCIHSGRQFEHPCQTLVLVTGRLPVDGLYPALCEALGPQGVSRVGDCLQPSSIADAVYSAHAIARGYGEPAALAPLRRERPPHQEVPHG
jgi:dimethylamine/trimethylamine dehydrogenase